MNIKKHIKDFFRPRLKLVRGTRFVSGMFIVVSLGIAAILLWAANMYYNIDTGEVVTEEIHRVTGVLRATAGAIVGGTASQNPDTGYLFQVVGKTKLATTTIAGANDELQFTGGTGYYVGLKANTALTTTTVYILPTSTAPATGYYLTVNPTTGQWSWGVPQGAGDITDVGDVSSGAAFTSGGTGSTLWFHSGSYTGALNIATLSANATYTLPAISGTNYLTLASSNLGTGGVLFADSGLIATSSNLYWDNAGNYLRIGNTGTAGTLRIFSSNAGGYYLGFTAPSTMTTTTNYSWPTDYGANNYVLTTDGTGVLTWKSVTGAGGVDIYGTPSANQVAFFYDSDTITGDTGFTFDSANDILTIGSTLVVPTIQRTGGNLTLQTLTSGDIILDPVSGKIILAAGDWIQTNSGYEIGKAGTQILREMIPILGFDLPVQTATTSYVKISRTIDDYPFSPPAAGTVRRHRFVIRYTDDLPTASSSDWAVATTTGATYSTFTLPGRNNPDLDSGWATTTPNVSIPTDGTDWWLQVKIPSEQSGKNIRVFQIFLAAYDEIQ